MIREIKNWWGKLQGYGCCYKCGDTWNWKIMQSVHYKDTACMFPLCKVCFAELDEKEIFQWCAILMHNWGYSDEKIGTYTKRLTKEIKILKGVKK